MDKNYDILCFGEILWDVFPDKRVIGGAPLNVALRAHSFGLKVGIISRVGNDDLAVEMRNYFKLKELDFDLVQQDNDWSTGYVSVTLDPSGTPRYEINKPAAWDYIKPSEQNIEAVQNCKVFLFGSLSNRNIVSRKTLHRLVDKATYKVFDVNLRSPDYEYEEVAYLMNKADMIKLNEEELSELGNYHNIDDADINKAIADLATKTKTKTLCVTLGSRGAILLHNKEFFEHKGYSVAVEDTVGSGDSFLATLVTELHLQKKPASEALKNACAIGAIVASKKGANPEIGISDIMTITQNQ